MKIIKKGNRNYRKRLVLLKAGLPRLVIRKTGSRIIGQIVQYDVNGDKTLASVSGTELKKFGWTFSGKNIPAAYLLGLLLSRKTKVKEVVVDKGMRTFHAGSFINFFVRGIQDGGVNAHFDKMQLSDDRMFGNHISEYFGKAKGNQFSKLGEKVKNIKEEFQSAIDKIKIYGA
jgi:ribosomal protein L18